MTDAGSKNVGPIPHQLNKKQSKFITSYLVNVCKFAQGNVTDVNNDLIYMFVGINNLY